MLYGKATGSCQEEVRGGVVSVVDTWEAAGTEKSLGPAGCCPSWSLLSSMGTPLAQEPPMQMSAHGNGKPLTAPTPHLVKSERVGVSALRFYAHSNAREAI